MNDVILKQQFLPHPIKDVWNAITTAEEISAWFIKADFKPEPGYQYTFTHEKTVVRGEVLQADPVHSLVYTWIVGDPNTVTTVKWMLEEREDGTQLTLEHSGISGYPSEEMAINMFNNFNGGWDNCLSGLVKFMTSEVNA